MDFKTIFKLILMVIVLASCEGGHVLSPQKWRSIGEPYDSLVLQLEDLYMKYEPSDSLEPKIAAYEKALKNDTSNLEVKQSRLAYWKARIHHAKGQRKEYEREIVKSIQYCDSNEYRYDYLREMILLCAHIDTIDGALKFKTYEGALTFARKIKDKTLEASACLNLGNLLGDIGIFDKSLMYLKRADSINESMGYDKFSVKNRINVSRILGAMGNTRMQDSLLMTLVDHPYIMEDRQTSNLVARNLYMSTGKIEYLKKAYQESLSYPELNHLRGLYEALLANYYYDEGKQDSLHHYAMSAYNLIDDTKNYGHKAIIINVAGLSYYERGILDSALNCRIGFEVYTDSMNFNNRGFEVMRLSALRELDNVEAGYQQSIYRRNMVAGATIAALMILSFAMMFIFNRRHLRQRIKAMQTEVELEKSRRKMAVSALDLEEKDKMLAVLRDELSSLRKEGAIDERNARRLESSIKTHLSEHESEQSFRDIFDTVNPSFRAKLLERCPGLADSYVKIACYILMEMDNKKIARVMMIKPESVKQARWRLRHRLGLGDEESLEEYLRKLNVP